jgi:hypothetical protein
MTWRETLEGLKDELTNIRARRQSRVDEEAASLQKEREDLSNRAQELGINELLAEMNNTLLDGNGAIETIVGWVTADDDLELEPGISMNGEEPDEDDDTDVITTILSWEEGGDLEIAVDLGLSDDGIYLQINEIEIRPERVALEQGLIEAFRDELEL